MIRAVTEYLPYIRYHWDAYIRTSISSPQSPVGMDVVVLPILCEVFEAHRI